VSTTSVRKYKSKKDGNLMINKYIVERVLGKGSFATVKLCRCSVTGTLYAIKIMNKPKLMSKIAGPGKNAYDCVLEEL
jgi:serine/threonine protein kinase